MLNTRTNKQTAKSQFLSRLNLKKHTVRFVRPRFFPGTTQARLKLTGLIFFQCMTITMLFAQAPSTPTQPYSSAAKFPGASAYASADLTYQIIHASNNTFGYDVCAQDRLIIHQSSIPALPGNEGFKTKDDAEKVALLVIDKIRKGEMPPTVSVEELKKLGVIH